MAFIRAYQMQAATRHFGRGPLKGDPFIGGLLTRAAGVLVPGAGKLIRKGAAKVLGKATGGKLIGSGGGTAIVKRAGKAAAGFGTLVGSGVVVERLTRGGGGGGRRYRRINPGNSKALKRAFRRIEQFGKLARKAGYVRRQPSCRTKSRKR